MNIGSKGSTVLKNCSSKSPQDSFSILRDGRSFPVKPSKTKTTQRTCNFFLWGKPSGLRGLVCSDLTSVQGDAIVSCNKGGEVVLVAARGVQNLRSALHRARLANGQFECSVLLTVPVGGVMLFWDRLVRLAKIRFYANMTV